MMELVVARAALGLMGFEAEVAQGLRAWSWGGIAVNALVTDAPPEVVGLVLAGARSEQMTGGRRAFF